MPSDDITIFYKTGGTLTNVIVEFRDFIFATIKQPMVPFTVSPPSGSGINVIATDTTKVRCKCLSINVSDVIVVVGI